MAKFRVTAPNGKTYLVNTPEGATGNDAVAYVRNQLLGNDETFEPEDIYSDTERLLASSPPERSAGRAISQGMSRTGSRLGSLITDVLPALGGSALGFDDYATEQMEEAAAKEAELQRVNPPQFSSFQDIGKTGGLGTYLAELGGEQFPNLLTVGGAGLLGRTAGNAMAKRTGTKAAEAFTQKYKGLAGEKAVKQYATRAGEKARAASTAAETGLTTGLIGSSVGLNTGEIFQNVYRETGELAPAVSLLFGAGAGALDAILPGQIAQTLRRGGPQLEKAVIAEIAKRKGFLPTAGVALAKSMALEGATEGAQEALSITAEQIVDKTENFWGREEFDRILESGVAGALSGGVYSAPAAVVEGVRAKNQRSGSEEKPEAASDTSATAGTEDIYRRQTATVTPREAFEQQFNDRIAKATTAEELDAILKDLDPAAEQVATASNGAIRITQQAHGRIKARAGSRSGALKKEARDARKAAIKATMPDDTTDEDIDGILKLEEELRKKRVAAAAPSALQKLLEKLPTHGETVTAAQIKELSGASTTKDVLALTKQLLSAKGDKQVLDVTDTPGVFKNLKYATAPAAPTAAAPVESETATSTPVETGATAPTASAEIPAPTVRKKKTPKAAAPTAEQEYDPWAPAPVTAAAAPAASAASETVAPAPVAPKATVPTTQETDQLSSDDVAASEIEDIVQSVAAPEITSVEAQTPVPEVSQSPETQPLDTQPLDTTALDEEVAPAVKAPKKPAPKGPPTLENTGYFTVEQNTENGRIRAMDMLAADMAMASDFNTVKSLQAPKVSNAMVDTAGDIQTAADQDTDTVTALKSVEKALQIIDSPQFGAKPTHFGNLKDAAHPNTTGKHGQAFWNSLSPEEKARVKERLKQYIRGGSSTGKSLAKARWSKRNNRAKAAFLPEEKTAVYAPGTKGKELRALRAHEVGAHYAIERMIGAERYAALLNQLNGLKAGSKLVQQAYDNVPTDTPKELTDHEALGYLVENYEQMPIVKRLYQMVKDWFAKTFGGASLTPTDLRGMVKAAMKKHGADVREEILPEGTTVEDRVAGKRAEFSKGPSESLELASDDKIIRTKIANAVDTAVGSMPVWSQKTIKSMQGFVESGPVKGTKEAALSLLGLMDLAEFVEKYNPELSSTIEDLHKIAAKRDATLADKRKEIQDFYLSAAETVNKAAPQQREKFNRLVHESTIEEVVLDSPKDPNHRLVKEFGTLPKDLQKLYADLRKFYKGYTDQFIELLDQEEVLGDGSKLLAKLFSKAITPYFPLYRRGEFWMAYIDPETNEEAVTSFENPRDRREAIRDLRAQGVRADDIRSFARIGEVTTDSVPPTSQFREVMVLLQKNNVDRGVIDDIYRTYLDLFPNQSIMKQFKRRKGTLGYMKDPIQVFSDVGTRFAMNLAQFESTKQIDEALNLIDGYATGRPDDFTAMVVESVRKRAKHIKSPVQKDPFGRFGAQAGYVSYLWYITGNISSALINLTQIPIVTYGLLAGKYGVSDAASAITDAFRMYFNGGWDDNTALRNPFTGAAMNDFTFGGAKSLSPEYQKLYQAAIERGAIRRSTGQDLMEARGNPVEDPTSMWTRGQYWLGWLFQNTERVNREVTLLATYKLARSKGLSPQAAQEQAFRTVEETSGSAMAELGPQFFQSGVGKIIGIFKRFAMAQIYLIYKLAARSLSKNVKPEVRREAAKQLLAIHTMAFMFAGAKGLPVYGLTNLLASMLDGLLGDDDEPFDLDDWITKEFGNALYRGPLGALLNVDIGSRTGFGDLLWRPDEKRLAEVGPMLYAFEQLAGPAGGVIKGGIKGLEQFGEGNVWRGVEAMSPSVVRNAMKGVRFYTEGALNSKGVPIDDDVGAKDALMQIFGFTPNDLADKYARNNIMKGAERRVSEKRASLLNRMYLARQQNDYDELVDTQNDIDKFNESKFGREYPITSKTLIKSEKIRDAKAREAVNGVVLPKKIRQQLMEEAGIEE